jgi:hypothetical protein
MRLDSSVGITLRCDLEEKLLHYSTNIDAATLSPDEDGRFKPSWYFCWCIEGMIR